MDGIAPISSDLLDGNGNIINSGDMIMYEGETYLVMNVDKDDGGWIGSPCGNNQKITSIKLAENSSKVLKI